VDIGEDLGHTTATLGNGLLHELNRLRVGDQVRSTDRETRVEVVLGDDRLNVVDELTATLGTKVVVDGVNETSRSALLEDTLDELTVLDHDSTTAEVHRRECGRDEFGTGPGSILARERAIDLGKDVHRDVLGNLYTLARDTVRTRHRVLEQLNDRRRGTRRDDVTQDRGKATEFGRCGDGLRHVHVHLVTVKVSVIRSGRRYVQAERGPRQNLDAMCLHRCLVERGLTVEEDDVTVDEVAVNNVTVVDVNRIRVHIAETEHILVTLDVDGLGTGVASRSVANVSEESLTIVLVDRLGEGEIGCDFLRDTEFVQGNVRIGSDDRTGAEIHTLAHEVPADTTGLGTETRLERAKRATRPLLRLRQTLDVVVHVGRHMVLKESSALVNDVATVSLVHAVTETLVGTNDRDELVGKVILHTLVIVHHDRRADRQRRNRENRTDHPFRARELGIESEVGTVLIRDSLEGAKDELGLERNIGFRTRTLLGLVGSFQRSSLAHRPEDTREGTSSAERATRRFRSTSESELLTSDIACCLEPCRSRSSDPLQRLADKGFGTIETDDVCESGHGIKELVEIDGTSKRDMPEVTRTILVGLLAGGTLLSVLDDTETGIKDTVGDGLTALVGLVCSNLHHRALENIIRVGESELNANDSVTHV